MMKGIKEIGKSINQAMEKFDPESMDKIYDALMSVVESQTKLEERLKSIEAKVDALKNEKD